MPEAIELVTNGTEICMRGNFRLHKFTSNSKEVVESIPVESRAKEIKEIDLNRDLLPPKRVFGVEWNIENDAFKFLFILKDKPLTRHGILSTVSSVYDPLSVVALFLLRGKRILQLLCKENIGWDDAIPDELRMQWEMWRSELPLLEMVEVPRCFKRKRMDMLSRELRYDELEEVFWTDSKVVQAYIQNDARRFHTFVASRVQQIRERTVPELWHYVDGKKNPVDDASRGLSPKDLLQCSR